MLIDLHIICDEANTKKVGKEEKQLDATITVY
jgi:hypothetical protein